MTHLLLIVGIAICVTVVLGALIGAIIGFGAAYSRTLRRIAEWIVDSEEER